MNLDELLPALHELPRADKFRAVQLLTAERAQGEGGLVPQDLRFAGESLVSFGGT